MQLKPDVEAIFKFVGYRKEHLYEGYRPAHLICEGYLTSGVHSYYNLGKNTDGELKGTITFISPEVYPACVWVGKKIMMYEGQRNVGHAVITNIYNPILCKDDKENPGAPDHIKKYCFKDEDDPLYISLHKNFAGKTSFVYKVKCTCHCERFIVYKDAHPSIFAKCCNCGNMITVYDLKYYPAAVKLNKDFTREIVDEKAVQIYVNYEYDDEFLYEDDVEFDADDITWGKVFIANDNEIKKILDDETA